MTERQVKTGVFLKAGKIIGTGHLMRTSALVRTLGPAVRPILYASEFDDALRPLDVTSLYTDIKTAALDDLPALALADGIELAIFDHYGIDARLESRLVQAGCKVVVIDDLSNRPHDCQLLFDQGIDRSKEAYQALVPPYCKLCLGPRYAMLNPLFAKIKRQIPAAETGAVSADSTGIKVPARPRVLICFGGSDPVHGCRKALQTLLAEKLYTEYAFTVVAGAANPDFDRLHEMIGAAALPAAQEVKLLRHCTDMPALYAAHDLCVGAYGVMFAERLCSGLPSVCIKIADNQSGADKVLKRHQLGVNLPLEELEKPGALHAALQELQRHAALFMQNGRALYDGQGLFRQAAEIKALLTRP
ncbi:MAG: UDP-2,4-diacetamido-2,4,6-trideoxy-beta-L-altropyranose hydrolase [Proteobacteria bacterium]|uniref:UDP-2,4-diacetamido-2,4, 6-trideoxy-beta-L-altropyranose hydrolase n=1 Tax=Candidatus Avisuccinivibrio stercorigallinarum TaxID=2840704 RepID=A0A9D9DCD7_9GAMM|nr:UDP-2,4-diacetamido-2,4,6-trideoxy-beta-L-altropyranose hydrolase [Candidatus Avisuccinivibrio stercorigallinarum]